MNNLNAELSNAFQRGDKTLWLPNGVWNMTAQVNLPTGFRLQMADQCLVQAAPGIGGFNLADGCSICGGVIRGSSTLGADRYTAAVFNAKPVRNCLINRTRFENWGFGISLSEVEAIHISNCLFDGWRTGAIRIVGDATGQAALKSRDITILSNVLTNTSGLGQYAPSNGVTPAESILVNASDVLIENNQIHGGAVRTGNTVQDIQGTRDGIFLRYCENVCVRNNISCSHGDDGITVFRCAGKGGFNIQGNVCYGSLNTVGIYGLATAETPILGLSVRDNVCYGNAYAGIYVLHAISPEITGNRVIENGSDFSSDAGPDTIKGAGLLLHNTKAAQVFDNDAWWNRGVGLYLGSVNNGVEPVSYNENPRLGTNRAFGNKKDVQVDAPESGMEKQR